jgi:DNA (cytosine-5)-methyltransferase 1
MSPYKKINGVSLFSSGGIGDLALRAAGVDMLVANEILNDRASLFKKNFPECEMIVGDIRTHKSNIIGAAKAALKNRDLDILFATPPCQGMSKNGRGKLLSLIRNGQRPALDERNRLIIDVLDIADALKPRLIILENVPEMENTLIQTPSGRIVGIIDYIRQRLGGDYKGDCHVCEFADYGVPQKRQRLITVFTCDNHAKKYFLQESKAWMPTTTHTKNPGPTQKKWISVDDAIGHLAPLDAQSKESAQGFNQFHKVPTLDEEKYFWVSHTPEGASAFDNQCANPLCLFKENPVHRTAKGTEGINRSSKNTPIRCIKCNELLPRPWVKENDNYRLMSGFTSAYKRMRGDQPASALTRNLSYACSDQKLHPRQNRVLSLWEAFIIHTISEYDYEWKSHDGKKISDKTIREVIGESIPPKGLEIIVAHLINCLAQETTGQSDIKKTKTG